LVETHFFIRHKKKIVADKNRSEGPSLLVCGGVADKFGGKG